MTAPAVDPEYGPDNPRDWNPNDAALADWHAPHEVNGLIRMFRAGWPGPKIMQTVHLDPMRMQREFYRGISEEQDAARMGLPSHAPVLPKGSK